MTQNAKHERETPSGNHECLPWQVALGGVCLAKDGKVQLGKHDGKQIMRNSQ